MMIYKLFVLLVSCTAIDAVLAVDSEHDYFKTGLQRMQDEHAKLSAILDRVEKKVDSVIKKQNMDDKPRDCGFILKQGYNTTGVYTIYPLPGLNGFQVRCDMATDRGGWTVIQRRVSGSDFYRTWNEYRFGFGDLNSNFWIGNELIHMLTSQGWYKLRVDLTSMADETAYAEYQVFLIGDEESKYRLFVYGYRGNAGDSLIPRQNGMKFSTKDQDNDIYGGNCAELYQGAWWYDQCHTSNLNGLYGNTDYAKGPVWQPWKGYYSPMKMTEMKIRRNESPFMGVY